jgi:hypothetical protein
MNVWDAFWSDLLALAGTLVLLNGALTGRFYTHGRGGPPKLIWTVKSAGLRILFLILALTIFAWLVFDLHHKIR